ncbi:MAG TPA: hypothetical protein DCE44_03190, partial [Verrucomicrobiales bacterium]|nr:hypothetical protein [Verrucomicrobiales bacterium]
MNPRLRRLIPWLVIVAGVSVSIALLAGSRWLDQWHPGSTPQPALESLRSHDPLQRLELVTYDWRARRAAEKATEFSPRLGLLAIDDKSVDALQNGDLLDTPVGPMWPRYVYGFVLKELQQQGAEAVAFDVLLGDERRDHGPVPVPGLTNQTSDAFFAQCLADSGSVILASLSDFYPALPFRRAAWQLGEAASPRDIDGSARRVDAFVDYQILNPAVETAARRKKLRIMSWTNGAVQLISRETDSPTNWPIDVEGSIKVPVTRGSIKVAQAILPQRVWHMGIVLAAHRLGLDLDNAEIHPDYIRLVSTNGQGFRDLPIMPDNRFPVNWTVTCSSDRFPSQGWTDVLSDFRRRQYSTNPPPESYW